MSTEEIMKKFIAENKFGIVEYSLHEDCCLYDGGDENTGYGEFFFDSAVQSDAGYFTFHCSFTGTSRFVSADNIVCLTKVKLS